MEPSSEVLLEDKCVVTESSLIETTAIGVKKDEQNASEDKEASSVISQNVSTIGDEVDLSNAADKIIKNVSEAKPAVIVKEPDVSNGVISKNKKLVKSLSSKKSAASNPRNKKPSLAQSLSFPAKGASADGMKKSLDANSPKSGTKHLQSNGPEAKSIMSKVSSSSASRLNQLSNKGPTRESMKETRASVSSARRASITNTQQSMSRNSGSENQKADRHTTEVPESANQKPKPALTIKEDDDGRSTTSSATSLGERRNSLSGFASRLDERAEKRKQFFSKVEEKIHAKEMERSNLQAKSKESHEEEIKKLRKSLTFKATPMPTFYKEPPPKAELKKTPTTRAISPKLGRNKSSVAGSCNSQEGGGTPRSHRQKQEHGTRAKGIHADSEKDSAAAKKPVRKSQPKLQPQVAVPTKTNTEVSTTSVSPEAESQCLLPHAEKVKETENLCLNPNESNEKIDAKSETYLHPRDGLAIPNPEVVLAEVAVGG